MKETYKILTRGYTLHRDDGTDQFIDFFDFGKDAETVNVFRAVNQFEFEEYHNRRPDIVLFINGIPVSVFELKNPADETVSIADAYAQTHIRYAQDIPSLMKFDFINVISDGANTRYGSLFSSYEFYFKWNSTNGEDYSNADGIESIHVLIRGLFAHRTVLNILSSYIYFPDNSDSSLLILPKYYQYYGAEKMYAHVLEEYEAGSGKGGTYWGATGCGKSYTMLFLSKRLTMSLKLHKPTIILLTDRNDLDEQLSGDFENAKEYLVDENSVSISNRKKLHEKLDNVESGGIYLMTIQKFSEDISLLSRRKNIICISDEAHRTQTNTEAKYIISKSDVRKTYGFAKYLRDSFPNATYVGFTGTPIDATLRVFGQVVVQYTMKQSLDDGSTVGIARLPGPREVQLDEKMAQACDEYYRLQAESGANEYQIEKSKKDMTNLKVILGNPDRLDIVVRHFIWHYEKRCEEHATVNGKAMFVCYDREIAWMVYKKVKALRPEWFVKRKYAPEYEGSHLDRDAIEIEKIALVCTNGKNDPAEMTAVIGDSRTRKAYARAFKDDKSNLKIAIVVDMWITGFDVPSMDTMYLDKLVETHNLIQTISRVNRVFKGKKEGLIVDYIGLEGAILTAMKLYNGDITPVNGIDTSLVVFKDFLDRTIQLMHGYDYSAFFTDSISSLERLAIIQKGVEYVLSEKARKDNFMGFTLRCKKAFDICIGHDQITDQEVEQLHFFLCVRSVIFKMTAGDTLDATLMNKHISELVNHAIIPYGVASLADPGFDMLYLPASLAHNISEGGACLAVAIKTKDENLRSTAISAGISGLFGITEPALYGVTLQHKKVMGAVVASSFIGGLFIGLMRIKAFAGVSPGIASMAMYIDSANSMNFIWACVAFAISIVASFVLTLILYKDETTTEPTARPAVSDAAKPAVQVGGEVLCSPLQGKAVSLTEVKDEVFSQKILGDGMAVVPVKGELYAPVDGRIESVFEAKHAVSMVTAQGAELLMHIGMDTVKLEGKYFEPQVQNGDTVKKDSF